MLQNNNKNGAKVLDFDTIKCYNIIVIKVKEITDITRKRKGQINK